MSITTSGPKRKLTGQQLNFAVLLFLIGCGTKYDLHLIGRVPLSEVFMLLSLPYALSGLQLSRYRRATNLLLGLIGLWCLGTIISDVINPVPVGAAIRGLAKPGFTLLWFLFLLAVMLKAPGSLVFYVYGLIVASIQNYLLPQAWTEYYSQSEYGLAAYSLMPVVGAVGLSAAVWLYKRKRFLSMFGFVAMAIGYIEIGAPRSVALISLLTAAFIGFIWLLRMRIGQRRIPMTFGRLFKLGLFGCLGMTFCYYAYIYAASAGYLGEDQYAKYLAQTQTTFGSSPIGLILGGRLQVFAAILAIMDNPLIGIGSWQGLGAFHYVVEAISYVGTNTEMMDRANKAGYTVGPGHSVFFTAWMENGLLAAISLVWIYCLIFRAFLTSIQADSRLTPIFVFLFFSFSWGFLFSPFAMGSRFAIGLFLALYVVKDDFRRNL